VGSTTHKESVLELRDRKIRNILVETLNIVMPETEYYAPVIPDFFRELDYCDSYSTLQKGTHSVPRETVPPGHKNDNKLKIQHGLQVTAQNV
jgi:hypothetical protein